MSFAKGSHLSGSQYERFIYERFGHQPRPRFASPIASTGIILCFVNRSGSNYLAECLASTGDWPHAREFFLESNLLHHQKKSAKLSDIFEEIVLKHTLNGHFATKLGFAQLVLFDSLGFLDAAFETTKFIYLKRKDVLGQAISLEVASQSKQWKPADTEAKAHSLQYSRKRITNKLLGIQRKYENFEDFYARAKLKPLTIHFEDLIDRPADTANALGLFLGHPLSFNLKQVGKKSHFTSIKEEWKLRFLEGG